MKRREDLVRLIRRSQTFISIMLFFGVFFFSWNVTGFELTEIQLSKWGETGSVVESVWNGVVCLLSISIFSKRYFKISNLLDSLLEPEILKDFFISLLGCEIKNLIYFYLV